VEEGGAQVLGNEKPSDLEILILMVAVIQLQLDLTQWISSLPV
jgi:hypothetical protein